MPSFIPDHSTTNRGRELAGYAGAENAAGFAEEFTLVMEGAYVTRQVTCNPATSAIVRRLVNLIVERRIPATRTRRRSRAINAD